MGRTCRLWFVGLVTLWTACGDRRTERDSGSTTDGAISDATNLDATDDADAGSTEPSDAGDTGAEDTGAEDTSVEDGGGALDAGDCAPFVMPDDCTVPDNSVLPSELRCTGLYADFDARTLACGVMRYTPAYPLWSDGSQKHRYVWFPQGGQIDAKGPNELVYPVGTKFWKEFRTPDGARLLETRLLQKNQAGWVYTSYVWTAEADKAIQQNDGVQDLLGTGHVVPTRDQCDECHRGRLDKILGWDAYQLNAASDGLTREALIQRSLFRPGAELPARTIPGDAVEQAALGYLHANCGVSCHNQNPKAKALDTGLMLRLADTQLTSAVDAPAVQTGLFRAPANNAKFGGLSVPDGGAPQDYFRDLIPQDVARSLIPARMATRGADGEMPALGTKQVDDAGVAAVTAWIEKMTAERGYPQTPDAGP